MKHILFKNGLNNYDHLFEIKKYNQETLLFNELDKCEHLCLVLDGEVRISTLTYNDKEYMINVLHKDTSFGEFLLFSDNNYYMGDIIASSNTIIAYINKENLIKLLKDEQVLTNYLKYLCNRSMANQEKIKIFSQKNIKDRIMFYLFEEAKKAKSNTIKIKSKETLAKLLNIPRPSLSRSLIELSNEGKIIFDKYSIKILIS